MNDRPPSPEHRKEWSLPADPRSVAVIRSGVRQFAREHGAPHETVQALALAVSEAVTNAVVHGFVGEDPGTVGATVEVAPDEMVVTVFDDGRGMQPRPDSPGLGMGLPLIGQMTASLDIRPRDDAKGTEICMTFDAPGVVGPPREPTDPTRLAVLEAVTHLARAGGWPGEDVERFVDLVVPAVADACAVDLLDEEQRPRRLAARAIGDGGEDLSAWLATIASSVTEADSPAQQALRTGETRVGVLSEDQLAALAGSDGAPDAPARRLGVHWRLAVPLTDSGRVFGLLLLGLRPERGEPDDDMIRFAEAIASQVADALANTRLFDELRRARARFERILGVLGEAITVHDEDGKTVYANEKAVRLLGANSVAEVLSAEPGALAARFTITDEHGAPVAVERFPGRRLLAGLDAEPLLTRSVDRVTGRARWLLTKASLLEDDQRFAVNIIEDITEAKEGERRLRFLADIGERLASTLDYEQTLDQIAQLAVPDVADWCAVDVLADDGSLQRLSLAHVDPEKLEIGREIHERYPPDISEGGALGSVLRGGPTLLLAELSDEMLEAGARDAQHLELLRRVGLRSAVIAPMRVRGRTIGTLSLVQAESGRRFTETDRDFAEQVARRAALAVDNARLFTELGARRG